MQAGRAMREPRVRLTVGPLTAHIPVLAISANAMPGDIEKGLQTGFFRYLTKPINVKEFMAALNGALESADLGQGKRKSLSLADNHAR